MRVTAKLNYLRIAPRKVRLVADLIRGKKVSEAKSLLDFSLKRGAEPLQKLLASAVANAKNNFQLEEEMLYISKITVDEGPKLKRWRARARGRAAEIQKKTSHISLVLEGERPKRVKKVWRVKEVEKGMPEVKKEEKEEKRLKPGARKKPPKPKKEVGVLSPKLKKKEWKRVFRRKAF